MVHLVITQSATSTRFDLHLRPISRTFMRVNVTSRATTKPSRCSKLSGVWQLSVRESFGITTRSSNITGVCTLLLLLRVYLTYTDVMAEISTQSKSERSMSPNTMNEDDRRELIARQHRALYGNEGASYYDGTNFGDESHTPRPNGQASASGNTASGRGLSPLAYNAFGMSQEQDQNQSLCGEANQQHSSNDQTAKGPSPKPPQSRSRANSTSSPVSNTQSFRVFENAAQQSSRTSNSSPGGSPPRQVKASAAPIGSGVAPIGTRPIQGQAINPALNKRSTTPLPSPLSYGFAPSESVPTSTTANERSTSAASNPQSGAKESSISNMNWGSNSGVWGKTPLGVQASVWG